MKSLHHNKFIKFIIIGGFCLTLCLPVVLMATTGNAEEPSIVEQFTNALTNIALSPVSIPVNAAFLGIPYLVGMFGGLFVTVFSLVLSWMFALNTHILPDRFGMIETGFQICLSIANLMFVVALIAIAFATILNVQEYNAKKMLGKVIVAAIAVNFSYLIVGLMLDLSHVVTNYFVSGGGLANFGSGFGTILQPQKFLATPNLANLSTAIFSGPWFKMIMGALSGALFTWIMAIVVISFAMMFLARYVTLVFLIILMPLAWALPLFPKMSEAGSQWWSKFIEQLIFLPAATFFVYLSMKMAATLRGVGSTASNGNTLGWDQGWLGASNPAAQGWGTTFSGGSGLDLALSPQLVIQTLLPCAFLIGSLIVASKLGGSTAAFGIKWGSKIANKLMGGIGRYAMRSKIGGKALGGTANIGVKGLNFVAGGKLKIPEVNMNKTAEGQLKDVVGGLGKSTQEGILGSKKAWVRDLARETGLTGLAYGAKQYGSSVEAYYKNFKESYDHDELHQVAYHLPESDGEKAGLLKLLVEEGKVKDFADADKDTEKKKLLALRDARIATNSKLSDPKERAKDAQLKALAAFRPDLASDILLVDGADFAHKEMDRKDLQNMSKHALSEEFVRSLSPTERAALASASREREEFVNNVTQGELKAALEKSAADLTASITSALSGIDTEIADLQTKKAELPPPATSPSAKANHDRLDAQLAAKSTERKQKEESIKKSAADAAGLASKLDSIRVAIENLKASKDAAQVKLQSDYAGASDTEKDTLKQTLKSASEKLAAAIKDKSSHLEAIKLSEIGKSDPNIKAMINVLERIERNTGSIAARDRAEEKHGHKDKELKGIFKWIAGIAGAKGGGGGGGHGHH